MALLYSSEHLLSSFFMQSSLHGAYRESRKGATEKLEDVYLQRPGAGILSSWP